MKKIILIATLFSLIQCTPEVRVPGEAVGETILATEFENPPSSSKPWVLWFWINGNITREGIRADLEAMYRAGIGGITIYSIGSHPITPFLYKAGPVEFMSDEFQDLFEYALVIAKDLDIKVAMSVCDGFTSAGGPMITPDLGMQQVTWSETIINGPQAFSAQLDQPATALDHYRDIAVLAYPTLSDEPVKMNDRCSRIHSNATAGDLGTIFDQNLDTYTTLQEPADGSVYIQFDFDDPFACRAVSIAMPEKDISRPGKTNWASKASLQVSDDGEIFHNIASWDLFWRRRHDPAHKTLTETNTITVRLDKVQSRHYRVVLGPGPKVDLGEIELIPSERIHFWEAKAGFADVWGHDGGAHHYDITKIQTASPLTVSGNTTHNDRQEEIPVINKGKIVDLSDKLLRDGTLNWEVPPGRWTIVRIGYTPTGQEVLPATAVGTGLECNKLDPAGIEKQFQHVILPLLQKTKQLQESPFLYAHIDSWEAACQNWTPQFREEFIRRRGYDPLLYLPVLTGGRVINNIPESERFLWDFRRTIADLIADNYYGRFRELCHEQGIQLHAQPSGAQQFLCDPIAFHSQVDVSMGEFWYNNTQPRIDCKYASSVGHIYGKEFIVGEAFTCGNFKIAWQEDPLSLKQLGDAAFCMGINQFEIHRYTHQPWLDRKPGMTFNSWGIWYDRTNTWWEQSKAWMQYLTRCQYLLRQGQFVADICCLTAEGAPTKVGYRHEYEPAIPEGYDYDACNVDVVQNLMSVWNGRISIPGGMNYRILLLPDRNTITLPLLKKIKKLVADGAIVVGPKPSEAPGLTNFPDCDKKVIKIAEEVWGPCDGIKVKENRFGKGKVIWGKSFEEIFTGIGVRPDFAFQVPETGKSAYIHLQTPGTDIFFIANQSDADLTSNGIFRVHNKAPQLWNPVTGKIDKLIEYELTEDGRMSIPLDLAGFESVFVLFRESSDTLVPSAEPDRSDHSYQSSENKEISLQKPLELEGFWEVIFPVQPDQLISIEMDELRSWTENKNPDVKYFSGTATYIRNFDLPEKYSDPAYKLMLELGTLKNIAEVSLNGHDLGTLWTHPFACDISKHVRTGENHLEIKITNLWPNRLIGDMKLPKDKRHAFATWHPYNADSPLLPSGLLGPVKITLKAKGN